MPLLHELLIHLSDLRELLSNHILFAVGILLVAGFLLGRLAGRINLPEITGFIIAGLIMGEAVTGVIPPHMNESLQIVTEVALGLIALTIGSEFYLVKLKKLGKDIILITLIQLLMTFGVVSLALFLFKLDLTIALLLGTIASATAPAATVAVVQSLKARGLFIDYLYGVVALDDVGCVLLFGIIFALISGTIGGATEHSGLHEIVHALTEIGSSVLIGAVSGLVIHAINFRRRNSNEILIVTLGILFIFTAIAIVFHLSPLLMNMVAGAVIINMSAKNQRLFHILEPLSPPIYALFFVLAGLELDPAAILQGNVLVLGTVYILARGLGKYGGVFTGGLLTRTPSQIRNYLGFCMLPQAGVAIGLVLLIQVSPIVKSLPESERLIIDNMANIVLFSVFINELIGPPLSKFAILRGNEMEE